MLPTADEVQSTVSTTKAVKLQVTRDVPFICGQHWLTFTPVVLEIRRQVRDTELSLSSGRHIIV